ncbi:uncharacterized protein T551_00063 [Pneumocystis jirovecii RU7]|uniref:EF-hand domain-containing protein n=1 Tax=Pneumocystis jirovecii (strain RU7) TaxID=1408657 RepID=A0A0W4ZW25_PNEJ7|nr:uncharacterized protein T551_00063 [Pneumocystis jirovecii RU7]KTW32578.1 hypothetical protein T551_00063 [Pneumocystis jirovecii RU7]
MVKNYMKTDKLLKIKDKFDIFDKERSGKIKIEDLPFVIKALDIEIDQEELNEMKKTLDNKDSGWIEYTRFEKIMALKIEDKNISFDVIKAFSLFDKDSKGKITLDDLKRVANDIGEKLSDDELIEMINEASSSGYVGIIEFENIMKRAGVF